MFSQQWWRRRRGRSPIDRRWDAAGHSPERTLVSQALLTNVIVSVQQNYWLLRMQMVLFGIPWTIADLRASCLRLLHLITLCGFTCTAVDGFEFLPPRFVPLLLLLSVHFMAYNVCLRFLIRGVIFGVKMCAIRRFTRERPVHLAKKKREII